MKKGSNLPKEKFDELLNWLSPERDEAGEIYVRIHEGLVRFFRTKGCYQSQKLADETINRVARKLSVLDTPPAGLSLQTYFYGFAKYIYLEYLNELSNAPVQLNNEMVKAEDTDDRGKEIGEIRFKCLDCCMAKLKHTESVMLLTYFSKERGEKIETRRRLAESLGISIGNLHIRIFRLKTDLRKCMETCLSAK